MTTILAVDDKISVRRLLQEYLSEQGFRVITAANGLQALVAARHETPDLILLDIMMPEMDGYDFIRSYRREANTPIIVLTAKLDETDKVVGLELGADDYITKPFGMRELTARVRAVLRRSHAAPKLQVLQAGGIILNKDTHQVTADGQPISLTPSEFDLLAAFMSNPERVLTRMDLMEQMPGGAFEGAERTVDVHIRNLRKKIEPDPPTRVLWRQCLGLATGSERNLPQGSLREQVYSPSFTHA